MKKSSRVFHSCFTLIFILLITLQGALPVQAKTTAVPEIMYSELTSTEKTGKEITRQPIKINKILEEGLPSTLTERQKVNQPAPFAPSSSGQTWYVSTTGDNSNTCLSPDLPCATINAAINKANHGDVIKVTNHTYYFSGYHWDNEVVFISKSIELSGGWDLTFTTKTGHTKIDAQDQKIGITVQSGLSVFINSFAIKRGLGVRNFESANTTLVSMIISDSKAGGILNDGTMTIEDSLIFNNKRDDGAGIYGGSDSVTHINRTAVYANIASGRGGGIYIRSYNGQLIIQDSTISNNVAGQSGGGVYTSQTATLYNVTIANNHAGEDSGGIHTAYFGTSTIFNSILVNNTYNQGYDNCGGYGKNYFEQSIDYPASCGYSISATIGEQPRWVDPKLSEFLPPLGYYPLLADSPAIDTGNLSTCAEVDQRGVSRPQGVGCDLGAYEYTMPGQPNRLILLSGDRQRIPMGFVSQNPLSVAVVDNQGTLVSGVQVTFTAPIDGASVKFQDTNSNITTIPTNVHGIAQTSNLIANNLSGIFTVSVDVIGAESIVFNLENGAWYVVVDGNDSNTCRSPASPCASINGAINKPDIQPGDVILVSDGIYYGSDYDSVIRLNKDVVLSGGWDQDFNSQNTVTIIDGQRSRRGIIVNNGIAATVENFAIRNSYANAGAGILNYGVLTIKSSAIYENLAFSAGAGIYNTGNLNLYNSSVYGNVSTLHGAGIFNTSLMTIKNSTISQNTSSSYGSHGGGIHNSGGGISIQNSIIGGNQAGQVDARVSASTQPDCYNQGTITSLGNNVIQNISGCSITPAEGDQFNINPHLGAFVKPAGYTPLLAGSPAINAGDQSACYGETDQRGLKRDVLCDIGSYEYAEPGPASRLAIIDGASQQTPPNFKFAKPLQVIALDEHGSPVPGVEVTLNAPESGASVTFSDVSATSLSSDLNGVVSVLMTANNESGSYSVQVTANGVEPIQVGEENKAWYVSPTGNDANDCASTTTTCASIAGAVAKAKENSTILIEVGVYQSGTTHIHISKNLTLLAGWNSDFTSQIGKSTSINGLGVGQTPYSYQAISVVIDSLNILTPTSSPYASSVSNVGTLTYTNGTVSGRSRGISNYGFLTLINATISGNQNGGIENPEPTAIAKIFNSTITNNKTGTYGGGGISNGGSSAGLVILQNSIVAGNFAEYGSPDCTGGYFGFGKYISLGNNLIGVVGAGPSGETGSGYCSAAWLGSDIVGTYYNSAKPHLAELTDLGNNTWVHALKSSSPALDTGAGIGCPAIDQRGISRPQGPTCDMGAFELVRRYAIPTGGMESGQCNSWVAACNLQTVLAIAQPADHIWVASGVYKPTENTDRTAAFHIDDLISMYGGFTGTETRFSQRNPGDNTTILSGDIGTQNQNNDNSYHVMVINNAAAASILDGFTIQDGHADGETCPGTGCGGGVYNIGSNLTISNMNVSGNSATMGAGLVNLENSDPVLINITFSDNTADMSGGGVYNTVNSAPQLTNVTFSGNIASLSGGGMINEQSSPVLTNVTFSHNSATSGGGIYNIGSSPTLKNVLIANSLAGGDCVNDGASVLNSNSSHNIIEGINKSCGLTHGANSNIIGLDPLLGPLADNGGFTQTHALLPDSPAINAGTCSNAPTTDQRGVARPQDIQCDIGAYEFPGATFADVAKTYWAWDYIERLYRAGITGGCSTNPALIYCPEKPVTRAQMAIFIERGMNGSAFTPLPASGTVFGDVAASYWAAAWIKQLAAEGITGGCGAGNYCPDRPVTRAQMAVFLVKTFDLP